MLFRSQSTWIIEQTEQSWGEKHSRICHAIFPSEQRDLSESAIYLRKNLRALVDFAKSMHRRKIQKVTALSEKVKIKSYKETSGGIMRIPTYSLPLEHYFAAII